MKKLLAGLIALLLCAPGAALFCDAMDNSMFKITGYDSKTVDGGIVIYEAGDKDRVIDSAEYSIGSAMILTFDADGRLYEAGKDILPSQNEYYGAQTKFTVPRGGFAVAFERNSDKTLVEYFDRAFDGIVLYNATLSMTYDMTASFDRKTDTLTVNCGDPIAETEETVTFLFVGNSSTYFNGTPIKFEALCRAAGLDVKVEYCTFGSATLTEFADASHERGAALRRKLQNKSYNYVVLQNAASASYQVSSEAISTILPLIYENGATPLLYMRYSNTIDGADIHYSNYTKLSKEFGITSCRTAVAFAYTMREFPEINLFAEDGGHHSKEGSYLAACAWLYAFCGIDPRGNTYTAALPCETAEALQNMAYKACTEPYISSSGDDLEIDNKHYVNLSAGCSYQPTGDAYGGDWTDTAENGEPLGKLTDLIYAASGSDGAVGCYKGARQSITIDLGKSCNVKYIKTDLFGNDGWGIPDPDAAKICVYVSDDGENYVFVGDCDEGEDTGSGGWQKRYFTLLSDPAVSARYVRLDYTIAGTFLWTSEISVYGNEKDESAESSDEVSINMPSDVSQVFAENKDENNSTPLVIAICGIDAAALIAGVLFVLRKKRSR